MEDSDEIKMRTLGMLAALFVRWGERESDVEKQKIGSVCVMSDR